MIVNSDDIRQQKNNNNLRKPTVESYPSADVPSRIMLRYSGTHQLLLHDSTKTRIKTRHSEETKRPKNITDNGESDLVIKCNIVYTAQG